MEYSNLSENEFTSMFGGQSEPKETKEVESGFQGQENSMFKREELPVNENPKDEVETEVVDEQKKEEDSLFEGSKSAEDQIPKTLDLKGYFEERIKNGIFKAFEDEKLETAEDVDALIEANFADKLETIKEEFSNNWYESKSNAWKFVAQYAENLQNPQDLLPIIQGVQTIEQVSALDPENLEQAELIVRTALARKNEPSSIIEEQISTFKDSNKLQKLAADYKPLLVKEEQENLQRIDNQRRIQEYNDLQMIQSIHNNAVQDLEQPFLGKHKLKKEEKAAIYDLIAQPDEQFGGYKIFTAIDKLYETGNFKKLNEIALLINNENAHRNYLGVTLGDNMEEKLMRKLKLTSTASTSSDTPDPELPKIPKNTLPKRNGDSGFGFFSH